MSVERNNSMLRGVEISEEGPGSILRDFRTLIDFVGGDGVKTSGKHSLLPMASLGELDKRMTRPLRPALKRPQQRSYPHLNGLYLLLRTTGLGIVDGIGATARLRIDEELLSRWQKLNATERYFNLLEAWLLFASPGSWGERDSGFHDPFLYEAMRIFENLPNYERFRRHKSDRLDFYAKEQSHLALLELFGLAETECEPPQEGENWRILSVRSTDFGESLFGFIRGQFRFGVLLDPIDEADTFGAWQSMLGEHFPEWQDNLTPPEPEFRDGIYVFKVSLGRVWRRIEIPASCDLEDFADIILQAFRFDQDHLYEFTLRKPNGTSLRVSHPACDAQVFTDELSIGLAPLRVGEAFLFLYDFGEEWRFQVKLERIDSPHPQRDTPRIVESHGKAPKQYDWDDEEDDEG